MPKKMKPSQTALRKRGNKMLATATKKYRSLMRRASKAANDVKREQYLAAALGVLVVAGAAAGTMMTRMQGKKGGTRAVSAKKKRA